MKVLVVHNSYRIFGGEDRAVENEISLLLDNGETVKVFGRSNEELGQAFIPLYRSLLFDPCENEIVKICNEFKPDVVHVHNTFPLINANIFSVFMRLGLPVVQTLHNYRIFCINGLLMRKGRYCDECVQSGAWRGILHRCYRDSTLQSMIASYVQINNRRKRTYFDYVNRFIGLSEFSKRKFVTLGLQEERILVKPNYSKCTVRKKQGNRAGGLFVGRITAEKGIHILHDAVKDREGGGIRVVGDGGLPGAFDDAKRIIFKGKCTPEEVASEMESASYLIVPSLAFEHFPMVIVEAYSLSLPVIASEIGALAEIVQDGITGLHFELGNSEDLAKKIKWAEEHPDEMRRMGENARKAYEEKYSPEKNYQQLMAIYQDAIEDARRNRA